MSWVRCGAILGFLFLVPSPGFCAQRLEEAGERWIGGLRDEGDYSALVLRLWRRGGRARAEITYPNQGRTLDFEEVSVTGHRFLLRSSLRRETWTGDVSGREIRGKVRDTEGETDFEFFLTPDIPTTTLAALQGTYQWPDGKRVGIEVLTRSTDRLLTYFDERTGEEQWLFPETDSTYSAGPTFEMPRPVRHRIRFTHDSQGLRQLHWSTGDDPPVVAVRLSGLPDTVSLDSIAQQFIAERNVPSAVIGIVGPEGLRWGKAYGYADLASHRAATLTTPYQIGSVTKLMTATVLMGIRDAGLIRLDDDLSGYLPVDSRIPGITSTSHGRLTIQMLLTHTSGLPGNPVNRRDVDGVMQPFSNANLKAGLPHTRLQTRPGATWSYSNLGYAILGYIMARRTRRTFEQLLQANLFEPLGMGDSRIALSRAYESRLAAHYWPEDSVRIPRPRWVFGEVAGFGGVTSTVPDLARFASMHLGAGSVESSLVASGTLLEMQRPHFIRAGWSQAMGLGWWIRRDVNLGSILWHGGEVDGHSSYLAIHRTLGIGVVVLSNLGGSTANDLGEALLRKTVTSLRDQILPTREAAFARFLDSDWGTAEWALSQISAARPTDGVVWFRLGVARFQLDRHRDAGAAFERAATLDFLPEQAMLYLARIAAIRGERDSAVAWLEQAVRRGLRNPGVVRDLPEFGELLAEPRIKVLID